MVDALNRRLLTAHAEGRRIIVIVDEAQNLSADVLEQVRLLTNLETPTQKLLQIILIGQPELRELLDRTDLRQLAQRITGRYHLKPLSREETKGYVRHRLRVAGATEEIFTAGGAGRSAPPVAGHSARHQCDLRSRAARRLYPGNQQITRRAGAPRRRRGLRSAFLAPLAGLGGRLAGSWCVLAGTLFLGWQFWRGRVRHPASRAAKKPRAGGGSTGGTGRLPTPPPATSLRRPCGTGRVHQRAARRQQRQHHAMRRLSAACCRCGERPWPTIEIPAVRRPRRDLSCLDQRGSWAQVRTLNRPCHPDADRRPWPAAPRRAVGARRSSRHVEFGRTQPTGVPR